MIKRSIRIGSCDTAAHGWTLAACKLSDPEQKVNYVEKSGGDGSWDLSTVLTDGIPRYKNRTLTVSLECSEGTRDDRERLINELINEHDGMERKIVLPDRPDYYLRGRIHIAVDRSTLAHAVLTISGTCEPWLYRARETVVERQATSEVQTEYIYNRGRRAVVPVLTVTGNVSLTFQGASVTLNTGAFEWTALLLTPGQNKLEYSGDGLLTITFREAVLR